MCIRDRYLSYKSGGEKDNAQSFNYTLTLPFVPGFSENLKRELQKQGIRVAFKRGQTLESMLCRLKFREPFEKSKNNIYKRNCKTCNFTYIGDWSQHQQNRARGHKDAIKAKDVNNSFYDHPQKNPSHEIDWEKVSYLDKERNYAMRMIKESLYTRAFDEGNLMNIPINSVWNEFQCAIRKSTGIKFRWLSFLALTFFAVISFFTVENLCVFNLPLSIETLLGLWPAESSEEGIIICRNVKF